MAQTDPRISGPTVCVCRSPGQTYRGGERGASLLLDPTVHRQEGRPGCKENLGKARGRSGRGILVKSHLSAHTHLRRCPGAGGTKGRGPVEEAQVGGDLQPDTHLVAFPDLPAMQGSSNRSASAQDRGIFAWGLPWPPGPPTSPPVPQESAGPRA